MTRRQKLRSCAAVAIAGGIIIVVLALANSDAFARTFLFVMGGLSVALGIAQVAITLRTIDD